MKIIHLSDLHFGTEIPDVAHTLKTSLHNLKPDLIVISGDFTQVASAEEFKAAKDFIEQLPAPAFCVPGNHDVPPFNLYARFFTPYKNYKQYINENLCPVLDTDHAVFAGINSARRALPHWNWANGAVSEAQRQGLRAFFSGIDNNKWRICILHHPIHKVDDMPLNVTVFGKKKTLQLMDDLKIDLVLTGHVHHASIMTRGSANDHQSVYVSASTALSSRKRTQENGFNIITLNEGEMTVESHVYHDGQFTLSQSHKHRQ